MSREFVIRREVELPATAEQVWAAITSGTAGWLWPTEYEPRTGGSTSEGGAVAVWDPPRHLAVRVDGEDGWFNSLDFVVEGHPDGGALLRYVHSGIFVDNWDNQYDGANEHTDFYLHTLGQYLRYFTGQRATFVVADGPAASAGAGAFERLRASLGLGNGATQGDAVRLQLPGAGPEDGVVDYLTPRFISIRTAAGLYRFFGRNAWGAPVGVALHLFAGGVDAQESERAWTAWLDRELA